MGTIVSIIVIALYVFVAIKEYDRVIGFIEDKLDFLNFTGEDIVGVIILGFVIGIITKLFWPIIVLVALIFFAVNWNKDKEKVKDFFRDLF